jgi:uncharacterized phage-associated protein
MKTVSARDVAAYILDKKGEMTTMKLQKLLYYCQAWSLVWDEEPLFVEQIEAWANGPVVREIYDEHRNQFKISQIGGDPKKLSIKQKNTINAILDYYGDKPSQWLSDLTHMEDPWKLARVGLRHGERGNSVISYQSMDEYYSGLQEKK